MKKTFRFLSMAAVLVVGAIMTGCSSDDNIDNPQQPANNDNVVTLTATVSLDGGAGTRAIDGTTGAKTFESGKQIAVFYETCLHFAESRQNSTEGQEKSACFLFPSDDYGGGGDRHKETNIYLLTISLII